MLEYGINWVGVVVGAIAAMIVGAIWYSRALFGKPWMELNNMKGGNMGGGAAIAVMIIPALITSAITSILMLSLGMVDVLGGATVGVVVWFGYVAMTSITGVVFAKRPFSLYLIDAFHYLVAFAVMGAVIGFFG